MDTPPASKPITRWEAEEAIEIEIEIGHSSDSSRPKAPRALGHKMRLGDEPLFSKLARWWGRLDLFLTVISLLLLSIVVVIGLAIWSPPPWWRQPVRWEIPPDPKDSVEKELVESRELRFGNKIEGMQRQR